MKVLCCLGLTLLLVVAVAGQCCKWQSTSSGKSYDMTSAIPTNDLQAPSDGTGYVYYFRPCSNTAKCNAASAPPSPSPFCQTPPNGQGLTYGCGSLNQCTNGELTGSQTGFWISYTGGDHTATVADQSPQVKSSPTQPVSPTANGLYENKNGVLGAYAISYTSKVCCPVGSPGPGPGPGPSPGGKGGFDKGWIFVIIVGSAAVVYLIAGILVMKFVYNAEGTAMIPNVEFWASAPGLMKDGVMYIVHKIRGTSSYSTF